MTWLGALLAEWPAFRALSSWGMRDLLFGPSLARQINASILSARDIYLPSSLYRVSFSVEIAALTPPFIAQRENS